ncbi:hypothetical protein ACP275_05G123500 [Erythranthe tilingii]
MSCLIWNCQGSGVPLTIHVLGEILRKFHPDLVFLSETKTSAQRIEHFKRKWNLFGMAVDSIGQSGGLALLWKKDMNVDLLSFSPNHIDVEVQAKEKEAKWRFTGFYGFADQSQRHKSWNLLRTLRDHSDLPWMVGGDFNEILDNTEKEGGPPRLPSSIRAFMEAMEECALSDIGFTGDQFTWSNNRQYPDTVRCRLDRVYATLDWITMYPHAQVSHLDYLGSDHCPIMLSHCPTPDPLRGRRRRPFRFEASWMQRDDCEALIDQHWAGQAAINPVDDIITKTEECKLALISWSNATVKQPQRRIAELTKQLKTIRSGTITEDSKIKMKELHGELEKLYVENDIYWRQRSRVQWIREGDRNTSFFHAKATIRKKINMVHKIKDSAGIWRDRPEEIEHVISDYFEHIFKTTDPNDNEIDEMLQGIDPRISTEAAHRLTLPFSESEFGSVTPTRGLRQGDPLSPYLFICCAEALIARVQRAVENDELHGIRVAPSAPIISNLCFADDTLFFCEATSSDASTLKQILDLYARTSGQVVNVDKSTMTFSPKTPNNTKEELSQVLGFTVVDRHEKYLGMPANLGRTRKEVFIYLRDRIWTKIRGWGEKHLSRAGKEVLIKAVLQAIPTYVMSCFLLPQNLLEEIESAIRRFWWGSEAKRKLVWVSWQKLCLSKEDGGLGFRDMSCFNKALLTKQAWRLITLQDTLLARVMKARYYPTCSFFSASLGYRPSATWMSILAVRHHLQEGIRTRIGDGQDTSIWGDPWCVDGSQPRLFTRRPMHTSFPDRVSDIINPITRSWNHGLIKEVFWPIDHQRILNIPIGSRHAKDLMIWQFTPNGQFSVKSCYRNIITRGRARANFAGPSGVSSINWKKLWNVPLPPKICHFLWRACMDIVPTRVALFRRKIPLPPFCPRCSEPETLLHIVRDCGGMNEVWRSTPFNQLTGLEASNFPTWLEQLQGSLDIDLLGLAIVVMWKCWDNRNKEMQGEEGVDFKELVAWSKSYLHVYNLAKFLPVSSKLNDHPTKWKPPDADAIKINIDAAFPPNQDYYVTAMIARDHTGSCMWWRRDHHLGRPPAVTGEAHATMLAMHHATEVGWTSIIVEGDCLQVMESLREGRKSAAPFGVFLEDCFHLFPRFQSCAFSFVKRSGNCLANAIAKANDLTCNEGFTLPLSLARFA